LCDAGSRIVKDAKPTIARSKGMHDRMFSAMGFLLFPIAQQLLQSYCPPRPIQRRDRNYKQQVVPFTTNPPWYLAGSHFLQYVFLTVGSGCHRTEINDRDLEFEPTRTWRAAVCNGVVGCQPQDQRLSVWSSRSVRLLHTDLRALIFGYFSCQSFVDFWLIETIVIMSQCGK
jgi:hypothetical protein